MIEILIFLSDDVNQSLAHQARESLAAFPEEELKLLLESSFTSESIFEFFSRPPFRSKRLLEAVILNTATPDGTIARLASQVDGDLIDAVLINLMRLLRSPQILDALEKNPNNTTDTRRRFGEIRVDFFEKRNTFVPVAPFSFSESSAEISPPSPDEPVTAFEEHPKSTDRSVEEVVQSTAKLLEEDGESLTPERLTTLQKITRMTVAERVQVAIKGSRDERMILIRDSNKVVSRAVLQSPKISENEVEWIAQMRNVDEEVLRIIGMSRAWAKNYPIIHNIVRNARAPVAVTLPLLNRLMLRDVKNLSKNKNVPEVLRRSAQHLVQVRAQSGG